MHIDSLFLNKNIDLHILIVLGFFSQKHHQTIVAYHNYEFQFSIMHRIPSQMQAETLQGFRNINL